MKIVYSDPKTGKTAQTVVEGDKIAAFLNFKINDVMEGTLVGLPGYKLKITGGSDKSGFPLSKSMAGSAKTRILKMVSMSGKHRGEHKRMTARGSMITLDVEQLNTVIIEYGDKPAGEIFPEKAKKVEEQKPEK